MATIDVLNEGKLNKALDREYNFSGKVMRLRDYLMFETVTSKKTYITNTSKKKVQGCYQETKDTYKYCIWFDDNTGLDVPKMVYDTYDVPEKIVDERIKHDRPRGYGPRNDPFRF